MGEFILGLTGYLLIGAIFLESCRIWAGLWWLKITPLRLFGWPLIAADIMLGRHRP